MADEDDFPELDTALVERIKGIDDEEAAQRASSPRPAINELPDTGRFLYEFGDFLQAAEAYSVQSVTGQPAAFAIAGGTAPPGAGFKSGTWKMSSNLKGASTLLANLPQNMMLGTLSFAISNDGVISWQGEGKYVAK